VKPVAALSLHSHKYRTEDWILVEGHATVTVVAAVYIVKRGVSAFVSVVFNIASKL